MSRTARDTSPATGKTPRLRALVVFDSLVGETDQIARAVIEGLDGAFASIVADIRDIAPERAADFDLIVTGEPAQSPGVVIDGPEGDVEVPHVVMKAWLANLSEAHDRQFCACFDTSVRSDSCSGESASINSIRLLHDLGYVVLSRQTFHVDSFGGSLLAGELDRAKAWADSLAARIPPPDRSAR